MLDKLQGYDYNPNDDAYSVVGSAAGDFPDSVSVVGEQGEWVLIERGASAAPAPCSFLPAIQAARRPSHLCHILENARLPHGGREATCSLLLALCTKYLVLLHATVVCHPGWGQLLVETCHDARVSPSALLCWVPSFLKYPVPSHLLQQ